MLTRLLKAHEAWFDVSRDHGFGGRTFPGYAEFHTHGAQYVLVKRATLWEVDSHEYLFFDVAERLDAPLAAELIEFMKTRAIDKVQPVPDHMSSALSLVVIADCVDDDAAQLFAKTRYRKNFSFGFRGWSDLRLAALDLGTGRVVTNPAGKQMRALLEANMALDQ